MNPDDSFQDPNDTITLPLNLRPVQPLLNLIPDPSSTNISPLEQDVLDEYSRLLANMNEVSPLFVFVFGFAGSTLFFWEVGEGYFLRSRLLGWLCLVVSSLH